jgi:hypothetical protein
LSNKITEGQNETREKELEFVLHAGDKFVVWSSDIWDNDENT